MNNNKLDNGRPNEVEMAEPDKSIPKFDELDVFPFVPDSIKESRFLVIEAGDLKTAADVADLMEQMWSDPEIDFYYFHGHDGGPPADEALLVAREFGDILIKESERRYYKHPNFQRNYVRIVPNGERYNWDWQQEVVEKGPEFWRLQLKLSSRKRDEFDAWRKVQLENHYREQTIKARYMYDVFLSYAAADTSEAQVLHDKLVAAGRKVFMAPKVLKPGDDFAEEIRMALCGSHELWLLVSPSSSSSEWVISEWGAAWALGKRIIPILHRCSPDNLSARLQKLQCIDLYRIDELITVANDNSRTNGPESEVPISASVPK